MSTELHSRKHIVYYGRNLAVLPGGSAMQSEDSSHNAIVWFNVLGLLLLKDAGILRLGAQLKDYLELTRSSANDGFVASPTHRQMSSLAKDNFGLQSTYFGLCIAKAVGYAVDLLDRRRITENLTKCQSSTGQIYPILGSQGPEGEPSLRHGFSAMAIIKLLNLKMPEFENHLANYTISTQGYDGGFGDQERGESHAGLTYCALAILKMCARLDDIVDQPLLLRFLSQRQQPDGGFNGRENKDADSCYSFWCLGSLKILGQENLCDLELTRSFLLDKCQCNITGGFSKYPEEYPDPLHSTLSLAALALTGLEPRLNQLDPVLCTLLPSTS